MKSDLIIRNVFKLNRSVLIVILLLSTMFFLEFTSALKESQTVDEATHLASGYSYLKTRDFRMNSEHPPLIKELSAFPLLLLPLKLPTDHESWTNYNQWEFGRQFLYHNTIDAGFILLLGRLPVMLLSLILGFFIYKWTNKLWGKKTALISLILFTFEPNIIAHSHYVTTDLGLTLFFFLTIYALDKYLTTYSKKYLIILALVFGLAQIVKYSAIILFPLLIILILLKKIYNRSSVLGVIKITKILLFVILISGILILFVYGFETKKAIDDLDIQKFYIAQFKISNPSELKSEVPLIYSLRTVTHPSTISGKLIYSLAQNFPIPAFSYLKGLYQLISHNFWGHMSYLLGGYSNQGFWYYFPIAFLVKTSIPLLIFLLIGVNYFLHKIIKTFALTNNKSLISTNLIKDGRFKKLKTIFHTIINKIIYVYRSIPFSYWLLIISPSFYFLWALTSKINIGHRHILPIYPFIIILVSRLILIKPKRFNILWQSFVLLLLIGYISSTIFIYPNFLAYFNELAGGPKNGPRYLVDSNIDWGQDLLKLKDFIKKNNIPEIYFVYFGSLDLNYYNINSLPIPTTKDQKAIQELDGVVVISITTLYEEKGRYSWLQKIEPTEKIGYSLYLYDLRKNK